METEKKDFPSVGDMKPLTPEQLRELDGRPVWIEDLEEPGKSGWRLVYCTHKKYLVFVAIRVAGYCMEDYGEAWRAYEYPPASIDREAWEPCDECKTCGHCKNNLTPDCYYDCEAMSLYEPNSNFCEYCGRPLTEAAWKALEKRFTGRAT